MTRKDYELIAAVLRDRLDFTAPLTHNQNIATTARLMADRLLDDNPNFNPIKFIRACGL